MQLPPPPPVPPTVTVTVPPAPVTVTVPMPVFPPQPIQVDKVNDWVDFVTLGVGLFTAIVTAGALVVAALVYWRDREDKRKKQAVSTVISYNPPYNEDPRPGFGRSVVVENKSDWEIIEVQVGVILWKGPTHNRHKLLLRAEVLYPHAKKAWTCGEREDEQVVHAGLVFRDANGRRWLRTYEGTLRELKKGEFIGKDHVRMHLNLDWPVENKPVDPAYIVKPLDPSWGTPRPA